MSSIPGYTLEEYVAWQHDLVIEDRPDPSFNHFGAELLGTIPLRSRLTVDQFAPILACWEPLREWIEDKLLEYDEEDHGSWRMYNAYSMEHPDKDSMWEAGYAILKTYV